MKKDKKSPEEIVENQEETEAVETKQSSKQDELEALREENTKLKNEFLRAYADAENTKKRCLQEIDKNNKYAISSFAKDLLSVADNLGRAMSSVPEDRKEEMSSLLKGVELTADDLTKVFKRFGIEKIDSIGKVFDPNYHQVVQEVDDKNKPTGTIINELQTGYMINDRILREAMVIVTKK